VIREAKFTAKAEPGRHLLSRYLVAGIGAARLFWQE
jgi:hypothetical protein